MVRSDLWKFSTNCFQLDILEGVGQSIFTWVEFMFNRKEEERLSRLEKKDIYLHLFTYLVSCDKRLHWYRFTLFHEILLYNPPGLYTLVVQCPFTDTCASYVSTESLHLKALCALTWMWVSQHCHTYITNGAWLKCSDTISSLCFWNLFDGGRIHLFLSIPCNGDDTS